MSIKTPVNLPAITLSILAGTCLTLLNKQLPIYIIILTILVFATICVIFARNKLAAIPMSVLLGYLYMLLHINLYLTHALPSNIENRKITIIGTISSVVEDSKKPNSRFNFAVTDLVDEQTNSKWKLPATIQLTWKQSSQELLPGSTWRLRVKLKRPRNYANPGSFDSERYYFQQRISATGYVLEVDDNQLLNDSNVQFFVHRMRQQVFNFIHQTIPSHDVAHILTSLLIGIKGSLNPQQVVVLQETGTIHLLAISGLHMAILVSISSVICKKSWKILPAQFLKQPLQVVAAVLGISLCVCYAALAGFSIATVRALIMVVGSSICLILRRKTSTWQFYFFALLLIVLHDPFVVLALGFWYSFTAVGLLIFTANGSQSRLRPQLIMHVGLFPLNLMFFAKASLISPLANLLVIPWVSFAILPLALLAIAALPFSNIVCASLLQCAAFNCKILLHGLEVLHKSPIYNWHYPEQYYYVILVLSVLSAIWLVLPKSVPGRYYASLGLLPIIFAPAQTIAHGQAEVTLLDVGQGLSVVVRTHRHVFVYDTGAKLNEHFDLGAKVVMPFLRTKDVKKVDTIMISHADNDHAGGLASITEQIAVQKIITSDLDRLEGFTPIPCTAGQSWNWDGVSFKVLNPQSHTYKKRNDQSCVLQLQAGAHKLLLTGDIEKFSEQQLIELYGTELQADILLVPHHGSKTSSSAEFIDAVQPKYALIPVGYKNQYGHPKSQVIARYLEASVQLLRTDLHGAITFIIGGVDLKATRHRQDNANFWSSHRYD